MRPHLLSSSNSAALGVASATTGRRVKKSPAYAGLFRYTVGQDCDYFATLTTTFPESSISKRSASMTLVHALAKSLMKR